MVFACYTSHFNKLESIKYYFYYNNYNLYINIINLNAKKSM